MFARIVFGAPVVSALGFGVNSCGGRNGERGSCLACGVHMVFGPLGTRGHGAPNAARLLALTITEAEMGAAENIPYALRAIGAEEVGALLGLAPRTVLETVACRPDFPVRLTIRPATWVAGEVLDWREANRAGRQVRRQKSRSRTAAT